MSMFSTAMFLDTMETLCKTVHETAKLKGFWENDRNFGEQVALMHSELSEALEEHRKSLPYGFKLNEVQWWSEDGCAYRSTSEEMPIGTLTPKGLPIEFADCVIRIMDTCAALDIDLGRAILDKMSYNDTRNYKHGKHY